MSPTERPSVSASASPASQPSVSMSSVTSVSTISTASSDSAVSPASLTQMRRTRLETQRRTKLDRSVDTGTTAPPQVQSSVGHVNINHNSELMSLYYSNKKTVTAAQGGNVDVWVTEHKDVELVQLKEELPLQEEKMEDAERRSHQNYNEKVSEFEEEIKKL
ncbi:hypothetical protein EYF80_024191 [Liparis tanakae]|uniref:Uncharacterized protein n=1 Tax=Liparis tanakae TaxID=230148 RepID=A0A4Z2HLK1_9TELE|nr:hypothetical protein EYF80_024191 [Liparis tanakae]